MNTAGPIEAVPDEEALDLWLDRLRRNPAVTNAAFRLAHAITTLAKRGRWQATLTEIAAAGGTTAQTASKCLDRLAALKYLAVRRQGAGGKIEVRIIRRSPSLSLVNNTPA